MGEDVTQVKSEAVTSEAMTTGTGGRRKAANLPPIEQLYRQVYDLLDSRIFGFETQIRINDRKLGTLTPELFMPIAERSNQAVELGKWSFVEMSDMMRRQREKGREIHRVFIPVSTKFVLKSYFLGNLTRQLEKASMKPEEACVVIAAASLSENPTMAQSVAAIREAGIAVALDGIGEGGVSLAAISEIPVDYWRLDPAFTAQIALNDRAAQLANSFSETATKLKTQLIADGIETKEQSAALMGIGCSLMQGAYFGQFERENQMF